MMRALVIGGTGPTGHFMVNGLRRRGYGVTSSKRNNSRNGYRDHLWQARPDVERRTTEQALAPEVSTSYVQGESPPLCR